MKVSEILRAGKAAIETRGWCQGDEASIFGKDGRCCAATALMAVSLWGDANGLDKPYPIEFPGNEAMRLLKRAAGIRETDPIAAWNDAPERTVDEVLAAYDKAIVAADALGAA